MFAVIDVGRELVYAMYICLSVDKTSFEMTSTGTMPYFVKPKIPRELKEVLNSANRLSNYKDKLMT